MGSDRVLEITELPGLSQAPMRGSYERGALRPTLLIEASAPVLAVLILQTGDDLVFSKMRYEDADKHLSVEADVLRYDPAKVAKPFVLVEHLRGVPGEVRLPIVEPSQSLVSLFVQTRRLPDGLRAGTCITWAETTDVPSVRVSLIVVAVADTRVSHGRWRTEVDESTFPQELSWLATGKRGGWIRSGTPTYEPDSPVT